MSRVASFSIDRGRAYELDRTETGTAKIQINDVEGDFDPTNPGSPYVGEIEPLQQVALALQNPMDDEWSTLFRGYIEDYDYTVSPSQVVTRVTISAVDAFAILSAIEMQPTTPATFGDAGGEEGTIFFDDAEVDDRILQVLGNADWPDALRVIFSGNVWVQESVYSPGDTVLQVIQDAADAEFPGVANVFVDRLGRIKMHGREAKFNPASVAAGASAGAWPFTHWKAGDGAAVAASPSDTAHIRELGFNRGLSKIINSALVTPQHIADDKIKDQLVQDPTSIAAKGVRSWSAENLQTYGAKTGANVGSGPFGGQGALDETKLFGEFYVTNFASPHNRINRLTFRSMNPETTGAEANWALLCGAEIGDLIDVTVGHPGGGGFTDEEFFIEGVHYEVSPLGPEFHNVTLTLDVSPASYFADGSMFGY